VAPENTPPPSATEKAPEAGAVPGETKSGAGKNATAPKKSSPASTTKPDKKKAPAKDATDGKDAASGDPAPPSPASGTAAKPAATQARPGETPAGNAAQNDAAAVPTPDITAQAQAPTPAPNEGAGTSVIDEYTPLVAQNEEGASDAQYTVLMIAMLFFASTAIWIIATGKRRKKDKKETPQ
jgi:hypothetical protein